VCLRSLSTRLDARKGSSRSLTSTFTGLQGFIIRVFHNLEPRGRRCQTVHTNLVMKKCLSGRRHETFHFCGALGPSCSFGIVETSPLPALRLLVLFSTVTAEQGGSVEAMPSVPVVTSSPFTGIVVWNFCLGVTCITYASDHSCVPPQPLLPMYNNNLTRHRRVPRAAQR
jgi:hypothetical protein